MKKCTKIVIALALVVVFCRSIDITPVQLMQAFGNITISMLETAIHKGDMIPAKEQESPVDEEPEVEMQEQEQEQFGTLPETSAVPGLKWTYSGPHGKPVLQNGIYWNHYGVPLEPNTEFDFCDKGVVNCNDAFTGLDCKFTWYSSSMIWHKDTNQWFLCDDGIYRDQDGYIILAGNTFVTCTSFGTVHTTPFGLGKVYDHCRMAEQIDCFDIYCAY